jgi:hypothetical protein
MEMTAKAREVFEKVTSLRQLTKSIGVNSSRTQRHLLLTLSDDELAAVAHALEIDVVSAALKAVLSGEAR